MFSTDCGNALTSPVGRPQDPVAEAAIARRSSPRPASILTSTSYLVAKLTGEVVIDHYSAANFAPLLHDRPPGLERRAGPRHPADRAAAAAVVDDRHRRPCHQEGGARRPGSPQGPQSPPAPSTLRRRRVSVGVLERRRHDADVRLDHLHHHAHRRPRRAIRGSGMRRGCFPASTRPWPAWRPAARSPTGSASSRRARARSGPGLRRAGQGSSARRRPARAAWSCCPISRASGRRSTTRMPRACSSAST